MKDEFHINDLKGREVATKWNYKDLRTLGIQFIMHKKCGCYICHYLYCKKQESGECSAIRYDGVY